MEAALPVASIVSALVAIVLRRGAILPASATTHGVLTLRDVQLVAVAVENGQLVIDLFGGGGGWRGYGRTGITDEGNVVGTPMLTFRAACGPELDAGAIHRLEAWCSSAAQLALTVDVVGESPLRPPRRVVLHDGATSVVILAGGA